MNIIVLMLDSLRQDHVSYYGWEGCPLKTPNIDALAAEAVVFDNIYPEGLPTIPVRTDLLTGLSSLTNPTSSAPRASATSCMTFKRTRASRRT